MQFFGFLSKERIESNILGHANGIDFYRIRQLSTADFIFSPISNAFEGSEKRFPDHGSLSVIRDSRILDPQDP